MNCPRKILYVDDEPINTRLFEMSFKSDYQVLTASDPLKGLELLGNDREIRLLVSDLRMPELDGIEFIRRAKAEDPSLVCILLSGYLESDAMPEDIEDELISGYYTKPWKKKELLNSFEAIFADIEA